MFTFRKPTQAQVIAHLVAQRGLPYGYANVGATRDATLLPDRGFDVDRQRVCLGQGRDVFERAKTAIRSWKMFPDRMCRLFWPDKPIQPATVVAVLFRAGCLWSLNPARIVYVVDDVGDVDRFGFAYGTLPDHLEAGEERFCVEWDRASGSVWYEILAFSRPRHWLARIGRPVIRFEQARFRRLSAAAMIRFAGRGEHDDKIVSPCVPD